MNHPNIKISNKEEREYTWNTSEPPNLGTEWVPGTYQFWPTEYSWWHGFILPEDETRLWWLFTFDIRENLVKKYFNPLKPDSARIVYEILPLQYADPDVEPMPKKMEVEIRDKDSVLVYGPRNLTYQEKKSMVLFWNGRDNGGNLVDMERSPFVVVLDLQYGEIGKYRMASRIRRKRNCLYGISLNMLKKVRETFMQDLLFILI